MSDQKNFLLAAAPLFLVIFIDSMGLGLVFPILNALVFEPNSHFISSEYSAGMHNFLYGLTIGVFMFCWFFGAAFLGDLSDQIGRKKAILICLWGAFISYLLSAFAVVYESYSLLLLGRVIAGFTAGSQVIAQAAIIDLSAPENKVRNLGLILFFCSLGFACGPIIGGVLSEPSILSWFNFSMPFYFAAAISFLNVLLVNKLFKETFVRSGKLRLKFAYAMKIFVSAFQHEKIRELSYILVIMILGWSGVYTFISMFLVKVHEFSSLDVGLYMGVLGVGFGLGNYLTNKVTQYCSLKQCVMINCILVAVGVLLTISTSSMIALGIFSFLVSAPMAIAYAALITMFSNQVDENSQGWIMGITGSIMAFVFGVNSLLAGLLANFSPTLPLFTSALCLLLTAGLMQNIWRRRSAELA